MAAGGAYKLRHFVHMGENGAANGGVLLHGGIFFVRQLAFFVDQTGGNANLADIVNLGHVVYIALIVFRFSCPAGNFP